jgi:GTPase
MSDDFGLDFDRTIDSLDDLQTDLNYQQARAILQQILERIDLTNREKLGLEADIGDLELMLAKLDREIFQIAVFGMVGRGKSSLINALVGQELCQTGAIHGVTRNRQQVIWEVGSWQDEFDWERSSARKIRERIEFVDTPGIDEVNGMQRQLLAHEIASAADLILFVITGDLCEIERQHLTYLQSLEKPILLVFNQIDRYSELDRLEIIDRLHRERLQDAIDPTEIILVAAAPIGTTADRQHDGTIAISQSRTAPQITNLKQKIWDILQYEGKTLIALNALRLADRISHQIIDRKFDSRAERANDAIWQAVMTKAVAIALNPITATDIIAGAAIDIALILRLSKLYGIPMTKSGAMGLLRTIALGMGSIGATELVANLTLSGVKGILAAFTPIAGGMNIVPYTAVAIAQATVAGISIYAIGQVTKTYLANGASWVDRSPQEVINDIVTTIDRQAIAARIERESIDKLGKLTNQEGLSE